MKFIYSCISFIIPFVLAAQKQDRNIVRVDSLLKTVYKSDEPGISIVITQRGNSVFKNSYGVSNIKTKEKISSRTNFNIGSLTKQFTAIAILQLIEKDKISPDDHLAKFFSGFNSKVANQITIQELLTHSSGIVDHYDYTDTKNLKHAHNADVLHAIKEIDSTYFVPGKDFRYSNTAYCLLGLIIEKLTGMTYPAYMKKNIFQPLEMKNTTIWSDDGKIMNKATGYDYDDTAKHFQVSEADENIFFSTEADGDIYTSIDDYIKWMRALNAGKGLPRTLIQRARSPQFSINREKNLSYGYGWFIDESSMPRKVYHSGSNGGFRAFSFTIPEEGYMIVIFSNRTGIDLEKLILEINKILRPGN